MSSFFDSVLDLIIKTSTELPPNVRASMRLGFGGEVTLIGCKVGALNRLPARETS